MIDAGSRAPEIRASDLQGTPVALADLLQHGPVLAVFFKISCPTCQYTFPFLQRMADHGGLTVIGVSQDDAGPAKTFRDTYGLSFPILLDRASEGYPASNAYKLTHVPSGFLIETDGGISATFMGFSREDLQAIGSRFQSPPFLANEDIPAFRPG